MTVQPPLYQLSLQLIVNVMVLLFLEKYPRRPSLLPLFLSKTLQRMNLLHLSPLSLLLLLVLLS